MISTLSALVRRTRQHHAIEHAALQLLAQRVPNRRMVGLSDPLGFTVFGALTEAQVQAAVSDAMLRLQAGEASLAIHPHCGTNLATSGLLVALATSVARLGGKREPFSQFARTMLFAMPALVASEPLGIYLQRYTTLAQIGDRWMVGVRAQKIGPLTITRVVLE